MRCLRFHIHKNFSRYIDGQLDARQVRQVEDHLLDCNQCRVQITHLRDGQRFAAKLTRRKPQSDHWEAIAAALDACPTPPLSIRRKPLRWRNLFLSPWFAVSLLGLAVLALSFVLITKKESPPEIAATHILGSLDFDDFHPVSIANIENNTRPHIVAEGYVSEVKMSDEDGDLMFKLVEDINQPAPFIVCEIISPINIAAPEVGSRVRVYGVSRYDGEVGRQWYEVHPVLNIEAVNKTKRDF